MESKIPWVSCENVCKSKADGGIGIRDLRAVNLALLGKWRWRILSGGQGIWRDILMAKYGSLYPSSHFGGRPVGFRVQYRRLFQVLEQSLSKVGDMGTWVDGEWVWGLKGGMELSAYSVVERACGVEAAPSVVPGPVLAKVWKSWAPSKVIVFSWQLL
ncbi:ribonuclease H protein [Trifolium medium]|uniref:Ribonuclease H protein n=1 Tax=Trifolium medium TaxID=97028 RepID=A0A392M175_9FABA|nr:ribonuclease H protein [Trifolium medium]